MRTKTAAKKTSRYTLLAISLVLLFGIAYLVFGDLGRGREARETDRIQGAQEQVQEITPTPSPAAPVQE